jgi:hypothetical protein
MREYLRMNRVSASVLVTVFAALFCCLGVVVGGERKSDFDSILSGFPGYHLLTLKERDSDTRAFILQHSPKANPSVVHADFDGDGHLDYALLLRNDKSPATKLVVLLCSEDGHCRSVYELDVTGYSDSVYLRPVARGTGVSQTEAIDTTNHSSPAKLKASGVQVTYFEQGKVVLYWNIKLKKIEEVQTAD